MKITARDDPFKSFFFLISSDFTRRPGYYAVFVQSKHNELATFVYVCISTA